MLVVFKGSNLHYDYPDLQHTRTHTRYPGLAGHIQTHTHMSIHTESAGTRFFSVSSQPPPQIAQVTSARGNVHTFTLRPRVFWYLKQPEIEQGRHQGMHSVKGASPNLAVYKRQETAL